MTDSPVSIVSAAYLILLQIPRDDALGATLDMQETLSRCRDFIARETGHDEETVQMEFEDSASKLRAQLLASVELQGSGEI